MMPNSREPRSADARIAAKDREIAGARGHPTRRQLIGLGLGAFAVAALPFAAFRRVALARRTIPVMGTLAELAVVHRDKSWAEGALDAAIAAIRRVEHDMTRFRDGSDVGRANTAAGGRPVAVGHETAMVLEEALNWADWTGGRFDPCLARAVALWDVGRRRQPPPAAEIGRLAARGLYRSLELERGSGRALVRIAEPDAALDLGGIAKGYGVDAAVAVLRDWGIRHALVGAGGDLYALGRSPDGGRWRVGVRSPEIPGATVAHLELEDAGVATSGDYEQFFDHGGERYHHLLDPGTGAPIRAPHRSVTVVAGSCMRADAAATALFGLTRDAASRLLDARATGARIAHSA